MLEYLAVMHCLYVQYYTYGVSDSELHMSHPTSFNELAEL